MDNETHNRIVSFIWGIADDCLRDIYVRGKYRDVILPMTVIRRFDAVLEQRKEAILLMDKKLDEAGLFDKTKAFTSITGHAFYNSSQFILKDLKSRANQQQLKVDFLEYLDGFSPNVQEIIAKFDFHNQIDKMVEADILGVVIEKFVSPIINLSMDPVLDDIGNIRLPGLDNHTMGVIFEELIRRFNEENNEEAGEHFTPRDVVELMADISIFPIIDQIKDGTYTVYDGACGTGGMLTIAEDRLNHVAKSYSKDVSIHLFGQEINPETYAITKADMLLKGEGKQVDNIKLGSTLSADQLPSNTFDFMLSNPPYGKSWKTDIEKLGGKSDIQDTRFIVNHADDPEYKMIPRSSDGQLLFLANKLSKMKHHTPMGSRIVEVHNGSSLFTGDAGQGESNLRRYIIENDWLEAIIALPENMFYNTGIATFIWVIANKKAPNRKGKVQLIDATAMKSPLRKNLGNKNCELTPTIRKEITDILMRFEETEQSRIFDNSEFGYHKITVESPLRLAVDLSKDNLKKFEDACAELKENSLVPVLSAVAEQVDYGVMTDYNKFFELVSKESKKTKEKLPTKRVKLIREYFTHVDEQAECVIKKVYTTAKMPANPLYGVFENDNGKVIEYEVNTNLRDTEQIPLLHKGGIESFFTDEVLTFAPDAWIDDSKTQIGYEISFTKYFYKPVQLRSLDEIIADIKALEAETDGLLHEIIGD